MRAPSDEYISSYKVIQANGAGDKLKLGGAISKEEELNREFSWEGLLEKYITTVHVLW